MTKNFDHQAAMELSRRREMEIASEKLLNALRNEHPRIIQHLQSRK